MADIKTYEYVWLDGYKPEPQLEAKLRLLIYEEQIKEI